LREQLAHLQRLATVGTMTAMVAHEFNNILTPMLNYAHLAREADADDRRLGATAIRRAVEGAARATTICKALLDLTGPAPEAKRKVCLAQVVNETLEAMARDPAKDGIRLIKSVPPALTVRARPTELKQVLLNLLLNARAAVLEKGGDKNISISAARSGDNILIRVADTGVGIAPENLTRIFEPFFTTRNGSGTGLGLPVCRRIIKSMNGRLSVRSQRGKGTVFTISLPAGTRRRSARTTAAGAAG